MSPALFHLVVALVAFAAMAAEATGIDATVRDASGKPIPDAVVYAIPASGARPPPAGAAAVMDQIDKEFVPHVLVVQAGTRVKFPNQDNIRHNVYSFSPAKTFSLELYRGNEAAPVQFDKPGLVVVGCNIHDFMLGYIVVVDTPHFAKTAADGVGRLRGLAPGAHELRAWHPRMEQAADSVTRNVTVPGAGTLAAQFALALKPEAKKKSR